MSILKLETTLPQTAKCDMTKLPRKEFFYNTNIGSHDKFDSDPCDFLYP